VKDTSLPYPVALKLTGPNLSLLLGEALHLEDVQESLLSHEGVRLKSSVLYMPLIKKDSLELFINTVSPEVLVTNDIDNPDIPAVIGTWAIFQTAKEGTVTIQGDSGSLKINTYMVE